jgi:hypothetical protein
MKTRGKDTARILRRRWVYNIKMDLGEVGWGDVNWIGLAQDRNRWRALRVLGNYRLTSQLVGLE